MTERKTLEYRIDDTLAAWCPSKEGPAIYFETYPRFFLKGRMSFWKKPVGVKNRRKYQRAAAVLSDEGEGYGGQE